MKINLSTTDHFTERHIGPDESQKREMLKAIKAGSVDQLIDETIPSAIRLDKEPALPEAISEYQYLQHARAIAAKNKVLRSHIGMGYFNTITPPVIQRNIFENPGWYTQYTPYQAEISQGRLEALLNFQTMVSDLTKMEIANASLLDEGTAAAEAMMMLYNYHNRKKKDAEKNKFFVSDTCYPQTIDVLRSRAESLGIDLIIEDYKTFEPQESYFGVLVQYPDGNGAVNNYQELINKAHDAGIHAIFAADIMSLALLKAPGEMGADVVVGSTQRFGVPMGYGGPHAAYFATHEEFKRYVPGRIIGVSIDSEGKPSYRMALQTREQHIKRERATSNICTAQALLAIMAGMYAVYHGPEGIKNIGLRIHTLTCLLDRKLTEEGIEQVNLSFFDTLKVKVKDQKIIRKLAEEQNINFRYFEDGHIGISLDETTQSENLDDIVNIFNNDNGSIDWNTLAEDVKTTIPEDLNRKTPYLDHPVFNLYRSETEMLRYLKKLEKKDLSLTTSMISLGSCTMKLNATAQMLPVSWPEFSGIHPFVPIEQVKGYSEVISELESYLCEITGFPSCSLQPNSGAQGEYTGLMVIRAYHYDRGDHNRNIVLIPSSAHGTNPASAVSAGMKVVVVKCDDQGNIDINDLKEKAEKYAETLSALMVTYPSTHGVFEENIQEVCGIIHKNGGQIYLDGANMNAQTGLTSPAIIGADVVHLNLHKTFSIPHGGGGPGMGPICAAEHLAPYLPGHPLVKTGGNKAIPAISAAPWGSASILLISYAYIRLLGRKGCTDATKMAILNANYIKSRLENDYNVLYVGKNGRVGHEMIVDMRPFKQTAGIEVEDIAKRLIDYNFHAPTISFPVPGTMMIEPTESESKEELDRFCEAMLSIREEIREIERGEADKENNILKNAPHTAMTMIEDKWPYSYSRKKAVFPLPYVQDNKFWVSVGRIDNAYGDRNLICICPPMEAYEEEAESVIQ